MQSNSVIISTVAVLATSLFIATNLKKKPKAKPTEDVKYPPVRYFEIVNRKAYDPSKKIVFILTVSLISERKEERETEYKNGIEETIRISNELVPNSQVIIVENTFSVDSFLNSFGVPVLYTNNNEIITINKGKKEYVDVMDVIRRFQIPDDVFIVKQTGRYMINRHDSPFLDELIKNYPTMNYNGIARFGNDLDRPHIEIYKKEDNCMTTIIGTKCGLIKQIKTPKELINFEIEWGKVLNRADNVKLLTRLGITARIAGNGYRVAQL